MVWFGVFLLGFGWGFSFDWWCFYGWCFGWEGSICFGLVLGVCVVVFGGDLLFDIVLFVL